MVKLLKKHFLILFFIIVVVFFYSPVILKFYLPIPADTIVGLYHPYRDFYADNYPNGIPFKNFLITDPVRQTYIWKELSVSVMKRFELPLWNPYEMSGKPFLANFQSGVFYPLNIILLFSPFHFSWTIFIILQSLLGGLFLYLYLKNLNLDPRAILLGIISFIFSGFFSSWLEWGTVIQTALWLPLILYSIDKIKAEKERYGVFKFSTVLLVVLLSSFFAGHLQTFFYISLCSFFYFVFQFLPWKKEYLSKVFSLLAVFILFLLFSIVQWLPTLNFINLSARQIDQNYLTQEGWFLPFKHLIQFFAPDFFGNPATLNYWGTWNYGELVGYIGLAPLFFAVYAILMRGNKRITFFSLTFFVSLLLSLPTIFAKFPFEYQIPLISTSQPTRLLFLVCFSLSILSAFGFNYFINKKSIRKLYFVIGFTIVVFGILWGLVIVGDNSIFNNSKNLLVAKRNLVIPTLLFLTLTLLIFIYTKIRKLYFLNLIIFAILISSSIDLLRFSGKFNTFSPVSFLYPESKITKFLRNQDGIFRIATTDDRIFPPNFATHYKLQSVDGYDPLYLMSYGQFIAANERNKADISEPFGFGRIITPSNYDSQLFDLLNVRYVLSIESITSNKLNFLFSEGQTKIYENTKALPRSFFVDTVIFSENEKDSIEKLFVYDLRKIAVIDNKEKQKIKDNSFVVGEVKVLNYTENKITLSTQNNGNGFLVLSDTFYPTWHAKIDGKETEIIKTNHTFRGLVVPKGKHIITFYIKLF